MAKIDIGNLELDIAYYDGIRMGPGSSADWRPRHTVEEIFSYDCETRTGKPDPLPPTLDFEAALWCGPPLPMRFRREVTMSPEQRRRLETQAQACEQRVIAHSGLSLQEFARRLSPYFPAVSARIPVVDIQAFIPDFTFALKIKVNWIHCYCKTNISDLDCTVKIRFPYAYAFDVSVTNNCTGAARPDLNIPTRYFELTEFEKDMERTGLREEWKRDEASKYLLEGLPKPGAGPNVHVKPGPGDH